MRLPIALSLAMLLSIAADASIVVLKDGSRLQGDVVGGDSTGINLRTPDGKTMHVLNEQIERIEAEQQPGQQAPPQAQAYPEGGAPPPPPFRRGWRRVSVQEKPFGKGSQELTGILGLAIPVSNIDFSGIGGTSVSNGTVGPLIGIQYIYQLSDQFGIGPEFDYFHRSGHHSNDLVPFAESEVSGDSFLLMAVARWLFTSTGYARPYISAGIGAHHSTTFVDAFPQPGFVWADTGTNETRRLIDGGVWSAVGSLRVGVNLISHDTVSAFEVGWSRLGSGTYPATPAGQFLGLTDVDRHIDAIMVNFRVGGRF
jgi:opacity protein-like surface antigen